MNQSELKSFLQAYVGKERYDKLSRLSIKTDKSIDDIILEDLDNLIRYWDEQLKSISLKL